jgi:Pyruvate/2-oxoacid:ferredoxin oxidoreductase delta subunit
MKESTKNIFKLHGWRIDRTFHNWLYFSQYDPYVKTFLTLGDILIKVAGKLRVTGMSFEAVYNRYHAKILTPNETRKILSLDHNIDYGQCEKIIPYPYANKVIIEEPEWIAAMDCPCRMGRGDDGCDYSETCIAVGKVFAELWMDHGTRFHPRRLSQQEALDIIAKKRDEGCITAAWFKVATGGRTGVICNCCDCCCGGLQGMRVVRTVKGGEKLSNYSPSGYKVDHDVEKCDTCGKCADACIFDAIKSDEHGRPVYNVDACFGCGLCVEKCPQEARSYNKDFSEEIFPLDIDLLEQTQKQA